MRLLVICCLLWSVVPVDSLATAQEPRVVSLALHSAKPPFPVLKYRLLPDVRDQQDGNAALMYYRAIVTIQQISPSSNGSELIYPVFEKLAGPPDEFSVEDARDKMRLFASSFPDIARGARRKRCEWDIPFAEDGIATLLPAAQVMRTLARALVVKAHLEILEGDYAAAAETLKTGLAMSRHTAEGGVLVNAMVGVGTAKTMLLEVEHFVQANGSPNLYWALSVLRSPLIDIASAIDHERFWILTEIPHASKLATTTLSETQAQELKAGLTKFMGYLDDSTKGLVLPREMKLAAHSMLSYPGAKAALIRRGYDADQVEAMPVAQVVALDALEHYTSFLDEAVTIARLPYIKAFPLAARQESRMRDLVQSTTFPLYDLAPSVQSALTVGGQLDRSIAQLIVVEAIRNYMAGHDGRLPESLAEITALPVPDDPITGKPFQYRLEGTTATLDASAFRSMIVTRYQITATTDSE